MNERLKLFVEYLKKNRDVHNFADFAQILGKSKSVISEMINGKRTISESFVRILETKFPMLNAEWLLYGTGEMLINSENQPENPVEEQPEGNSMINSLLSLVESQRKDIETLIQIVKDKDDKIDELLKELLIYKGDNVRSAGDSSSVNVG